uniref:Uncharacterized protein n=1 Tax=Xenopus tropicalis TaxID=8364 RepID=A0A803KD46_XENTR
MAASILLIVIAGDGQFDSPGHSAKYCIYSFMDVCLDGLLADNVNVKIVATDRHPAIRNVIYISKWISSLTNHLEAPWIKPGNPAHAILASIVKNKNLLKVPKYRLKQIASMHARTVLAILLHNRNVNRPQATVKCKFVFPKHKQNWVTRAIFEEVVDDHLIDIADNSVKILSGDLTHNWDSNSSSVPANIAKLERPDKNEMISKRVKIFSIKYS